MNTECELLAERIKELEAESAKKTEVLIQVTNLLATELKARREAEKEMERALNEDDEKMLEFYLYKQQAWSRATFGEGRRTVGILQHIRKELLEIEAAPEDLSEWVDVIILALDGYWRHGGKSVDIMDDLRAKQAKNMARSWPKPTSEDEAVEHIRA